MSKSFFAKLSSIQGMGVAVTGVMIAMATILSLNFIELKKETSTLKEEWQSFQTILSPSLQPSAAYTLR